MKRIPTEIASLMADQYRSGRTAAQISVSTGFSPDAVRYHLRKSGCFVYGRDRASRITPEFAAAALKMHRGGICWKKVSDLLGCNTQRLQVEAWKFRDSQINQERDGK